MLEDIYLFLSKLGYTHPLHPPVTSLPLGMVTGAFLFGLAAMVFRRPELRVSARHCIGLAFLGVFPTILLGYMDWQHYYNGSWLYEIKMKVGLAAGLLALLCVALVLSRVQEYRPKIILLVYALCFTVVIALGFFGGELVFKGKVPAPKVQEGIAGKGAAIFRESCSKCHSADTTNAIFGPGLKGLFAREKLPASGLPATEANVRQQLTKPFKIMPAFTSFTPDEVDALIAHLKTL